MQLKIRTEYSYGKVYAPIDLIIKKLIHTDVKLAGIVDHSSTWGYARWQKACEDAGIRAVFGLELFVLFREKLKSMWFLAKSQDGISELYAANSRAHKNKNICGSPPFLHSDDDLFSSKNLYFFAGEVLDEAFLKNIDAIMDLSPSSVAINTRKEEIAAKNDLMMVNICDNFLVDEKDKPLLSFMPDAFIKQTRQDIVEVKNNFSLYFPQVRLPYAELLKAEGDLGELCLIGAKKKNIDLIVNVCYKERLERELKIIKNKNFESYFLIVSDMVQHAKKTMLVGPSRGSAAGSLVCYLTEITEIDPIQNGLLFERFLDESRGDPPDIDLDFPDSKRDQIFTYMREKYGNKNVAQLGSVLRFKPKSILVKACKLYGIPQKDTFLLKSSLIEREFGDERVNFRLKDTFESTENGREFIKKHPAFKIVENLEGHASHAGTHAAGLLVSQSEISKVCSVNEKGIAQVDKYDAEKINLLKIDILGLRTLTILEEVLDEIVRLDLYNLPLACEKTFSLMNSGNLCGVFQFEGETVRKICKSIKIESIWDIAAISALARPGPLQSGVAQTFINRKNGEQFYTHPLLEKITSETYGLPIFQEQTLEIVKTIGCFTWNNCTLFRKAISKSLGQEKLTAFFYLFEEGAKRNGLREAEILQIWEMICKMGAYQMNKSHTYSYAVISFWTAYLKANFPLTFAAATLRNVKDEESLLKYLQELTLSGVNFVPFDIEKSKKDWSVNDSILFGGFKTLKGIGDSKAEKLIKDRDAVGLTQKQIDFINKCPCVVANLFPLRSKTYKYYEVPKEFGLQDAPCFISDLTEQILHRDERVFIGEVTYIERKIDTVDFRVKDDTSQIGGRISKFDYPSIGVQFSDEVAVGDVILIRAAFYNRIRFAFLKKWRKIL